MRTIFCLILAMFSLISSLLYGEYYDGVFIIVNDDAVSYNDFINNYEKIRLEYGRMNKALPADTRTLIFQNMINEKIIQQVADKKEVFVSDTEIDETIDRIQKINHLNTAQFREELAKQGKTLEDFRQEYQKQLLSEKIMGLELQPRISYPTDEEIEDYYNKNKNDMYEPVKYRISHILLRDNPNASLTERSKIKKLAQEILTRAVNKENFEALAKKYSMDETSNFQGGDIGFVARGEWLPEIDEFVFKLNKGQIAPQILQSRWGWHIVKVTDKKNRAMVPFNEMKGRLENYLVKKRMQDEFDNWINDQMNESYVEVVFPDNEKFIFENNEWKKKHNKSSIAKEDLIKKLNSLPL